ncbi:hypothetical protein GH714_018367 [Hevea brasiliensis]|uniref:Chalcone isomerase domain-containing protein n=1 Tax=Hevea brasiliensis TaxID=3981 RepID=A0A6A6KW56_HEVBR|nr:hypothetical protein GH714_018313 [Hevea brasiliensis]KAF2292275.1 hypothetical protein GH714_018367 [Hevea brasiliensis]
MATLSENVAAKDQTPVEEKVNGVEQKATNGVNCENAGKAIGEPTVEKVQEEMKTAGKEAERIYTDNEKLKDLLKSNIGKAPAKPSKEMYQVAIDSDLPMMVRLVIVFSGLTMSMVKKNFDEGLGASIKKLTGGKKNEELANKVMGQAPDEIKLTSGSVIEISRLPGFVLQTKVMDEVVSKVESELLCRAYIHMYLGDDPFDKDAKEKFGMSLLSLF